MSTNHYFVKIQLFPETKQTRKNFCRKAKLSIKLPSPRNHFPVPVRVPVVVKRTSGNSPLPVTAFSLRHGFRCLFQTHHHSESDIKYSGGKKNWIKKRKLLVKSN